ncbi:MAG: V-type ATP synthase subunit D [Promethearchaeota archaeon]
MSFQKVKATKPELQRLQLKKTFSKRGERLLEIKREQVAHLLRLTMKRFFHDRERMRKLFMKTADLLESTYENIGKRKFQQIANLNSVHFTPTVNVTYVHEDGLDLPKIRITFPKRALPSYSFTDTSIHVDILTNRLKKLLTDLCALAEENKKMILLGTSNLRIQHRIDALDDIIIPQLELSINMIEDILSDEEREEFIRLKKIKEILENKEK